MEESLRHMNLRIFGSYAKEIDILVSAISSELIDFTNYPKGNEEMVLKLLRDAYGEIMYLKKL